MNYEPGRHEAMPFAEFERIVRAAATKVVSFHFETEGARQGLPPDVLTMLFGTNPGDDEGLWFNIRRGEVPEKPIYRFWEEPPSELQQLWDAGVIYRTHGPQPRGLWSTSRMKREKVYEGWRPVLFTALKMGLLRRTADLEQWLGTRDCDQARSNNRLLMHELSEPVREAVLEQRAEAGTATKE